MTALQQEECKLFASKYQVTDHCLGHGAEAAVCLANDVQTGKQLVCKLVNLDKIHGKNAQDEIRRKFQEADILRQLHHVSLLSLGVTKSSQLLMAYGTTLQSACSDSLLRSQRYTASDPRIFRAPLTQPSPTSCLTWMPYPLHIHCKYLDHRLSDSLTLSSAIHSPSLLPAVTSCHSL